MMILPKIEKRFSTFEVAKVCGVFHTTVINWVNKGKLKAYYTPGGHRRVLLSDLLAFMRQFEMPIPQDLVERRRKILLVEDDLSVQRMMSRCLQALPETDLQTCVGGLEALMSIGKEPPDLLILDIRIPQVNGMEVIKLLKSNEHTRQVRIVAISGELLTREEEIFLFAHTDQYFRKPVPTAQLKECVLELLEPEAHPAGTRS